MLYFQIWRKCNWKVIFNEDRSWCFHVNLLPYWLLFSGKWFRTLGLGFHFWDPIFVVPLVLIRFRSTQFIHFSVSFPSLERKKSHYLQQREKDLFSPSLLMNTLAEEPLIGYCICISGHCVVFLARTARATVFYRS